MTVRCTSRTGIIHHAQLSRRLYSRRTKHAVHRSSHIPMSLLMSGLITIIQLGHLWTIKRNRYLDHLALAPNFFLSEALVGEYQDSMGFTTLILTDYSPNFILCTSLHPLLHSSLRFSYQLCALIRPSLSLPLLCLMYPPLYPRQFGMAVFISE